MHLKLLNPRFSLGAPEATIIMHYIPAITGRPKKCVSILVDTAVKGVSIYTPAAQN